MDSLRVIPHQRRAHATIDGILDACEGLVVELGASAITTNRIAQRASIGVGTLYRYFDNKDAILGELLHRYARLMLARVVSVVSTSTGSDPEGELRALVGAIASPVTEHLTVYVGVLPVCNRQTAALEEIHEKVLLLAREWAMRCNLGQAVPNLEVRLRVVVSSVQAAIRDCAAHDEASVRTGLAVSLVGDMAVAMVLASKVDGVD